jgi:RimJ/RimL family protein N-acetyltransferase
MSTRLETARLVIRTFEAADAEPFLAMVSDPQVRRFLPPGPPPRAEEFGRILQARHAMEEDIGYTMWAVVDKATSAFIGQCGIRPVNEGYGPENDLAYHFARAVWSKGYGTEAAIAVLAHGLGQVGLDRVMAVVVSANVGSWRVMEKAGMRYEGIANYYGLENLKKYVADKAWWTPPGERAAGG